MNAAGAGPRPARGLLPGVLAFKTSPSSASLRSPPSPYEGDAADRSEAGEGDVLNARTPGKSPRPGPGPDLAPVIEQVSAFL